MEKELKIKMYSFTLDCINPYALAKFYAELLNWEIPFYDENWACIGAPGMSQGAIREYFFSEIQSTVRLCGRKNREYSSRWRIWTLQSMIWKKRFSMRLTAEQQWQLNSFLKNGV